MNRDDRWVKAPHTSTVASTTNEDEAGWPTVMNYMSTYDESMMKDYSDDIDTLLVLAGLFSAVLTAFIVESYTTLQADNSDSSVQLLTRISSQLESYHIQAPFINSTLGPSPPAPPFRPTNAARWINSLWFLSLLFSLAAAVIGILAKQWIREYQKWNEATASPRENVLVRRIRYESWEVWHTVTIISSIPAMLELAVVLFVCGLIVFLWTVDVVVAIVISVFSAIFLIAVSTFTLLPAFFKRCPYKSPTAWVCVRAVAAIKRIVASLHELILAMTNVKAAMVSWKLYSERVVKLSRTFILSVHSEEREVLSWRRRDIEDGCAKTCPDAHGQQLTSTSLMTVVQTEMSEISSDGSFTPPPSTTLGKKTPDLGLQGTRIASEAVHLFAALVWAAAVSTKEDVLLLDGMQSCARDLYSWTKRFPINGVGAVECAVVRGVRHVVLWTLFDDLFTYMPPAPRTNEKFSPVVSVKRWLHSRYTLGTVGPARQPRPMYISPEPITSSGPETQLVTGPFFTQQRISRQIFSIMLAQEIKTTVVETLTLGLWLKDDDGLFKRRVAELLSAFQYATAATTAERSTWIQQSIPILLDTFNLISASPCKERFEFMYPGVRASLIEVVWRRTTVRWQLLFGDRGDRRIQLYPGDEQDDYTDMWLTLAGLDLLPDLSPSREDCYIHHHIVSNALANILKAQSAPERLSIQVFDMLSKMTAVLHSARNLEWANGGTYADRLPWLAPLLGYDCLVAKFLCRTVRTEFERFVEEMEASVALITDGEQAVKKLKAVLESRPRSVTPVLRDPIPGWGGMGNFGWSPRELQSVVSSPHSPDAGYFATGPNSSREDVGYENAALSSGRRYPLPVFIPPPGPGALGRYYEARYPSRPPVEEYRGRQPEIEDRTATIKGLEESSLNIPGHAG